MVKCLRSRLFLVFALTAAASVAQGAGVSAGAPLGAAFVSRPIGIDGVLDDWPEVGSSRIAPFRDVSDKTSPAMARVFADHPGLLRNQAELMLAHDAEALYVGIRFGHGEPVLNAAPSPSEWHRGGNGLAVHATDAQGRAFSILWWGADADGRPRVAWRHGAGDWQGPDTMGVTAAMQVAPDRKECQVEIRTPWAALGMAEPAPPSRLDLVWEAAFHGVDRELLKALPQEMRIHMKQHSTYNVLTAPEKTASRDYLSRPQWWGAIRFGDTNAHPGHVRETAHGSGIAEWTAPRTPKPIAIDGALDDWPAAWLLSAAPSPWAYGDRYRSDTGICWDPAMLYLAVRFHDGEPMFNTETAEEQRGFHGGDCLQVRLKIGETVSNLCGWYDSKNGLAALTADGKERKEPNLLAAGAHQAFSPLPGGRGPSAGSGRGYIQEIAIPFSQLAPQAPVIGDTWNMTFQLWWSGIDERFSVETSVDLMQPAALRTAYELPRDAQVSLGVFDRQGRLLRHLVKAESRTHGANVESWDGLDQWNRVIPPGEYVLKGVHHEPLALDYVMTATSPGNPPWWTVDGRGGWLSDQAAAQDIVSDGESVYIAAPYAEAGHAIIAVGPAGQRLWGINPSVGTPRAVSLALMGERLYALFSGPELIENVRQYKAGDPTAQGRAILMCFNKRTGELAGPSVASGAPIRVATWEYRHDVHNLWDLRLSQTFSPATYGGMHRYSNTGMCETTGALGLTAVGDRLVASLFYGNELVILDPDTFKIAGRIPLDAPVGLHGLDARSLLAVSGKQVVKVDIDTATVTPVITVGLLAPFGVTTDLAGRLYVSDWGASFQVKTFSPEGVLLQSIGKAGGRPWIGNFTPEAMALPRGMAVTDDGKLWVAEDEFSPRRVSVWKTDSGALIRDYIGPANYRGWGLAIDPLHPRRIVTCGTEFDLDFEKKTFTPVRKMFLRRGRDDVFMPDGNDMGAYSRIVYRHGQEFFVTGSRDRIHILQRRGDEYRPVAAVSGLEAGLTIDGTQRAFWDSDLRYHFLPDWNPACFKGQAGNNHIWNDLNGDGLVQPDEVEWTDTLRRGDVFVQGRMGEWGVSWGLGFGPDWEIYIHGFCRDAAVIYRLDPEFSDEGLPRYSFGRCRPIIHHDTRAAPLQVANLYASTSGKLYVTYAHDVNRQHFAEKALVCYDRDGNEQWSIAGPRDLSPKSLYGYANAEFHYPELGSGVVTWVWWHNGRAYVLADDGLYLGGFLDNDVATGPTAARLGGEVSTFAFQKPDGRLYLVNGANSAHHILEIRGLETARRFEQALTVTQADADAAARALGAGAEREKEPPVILVKHTDALPPMDGSLNGWDLEADGVHLTTTRKPGRGGRLALKTDGESLFIAARILDETPMVNHGENWQTPFITGDAIDLMLATDPAADPERRRAAAGDIRLLFTELRGAPLAVLYRPVAPDAKDPVQMLATTIDDIRRVPEAAPIVRREADGYTLTARVPLSVLGIGTLPREWRGDVGLIYGDATGRDRDQRLYYYNKTTAMISDLTTEASLSPDSWGPIVFVLAGNGVHNGGFEAELGDPAVGHWHISRSDRGATARLDDKQVFAGRRALLLEQETAVKLPANADSIRDHGEFYRQLNDGAGGGIVHLDQRIPVTGGQSYDLRFAYRAENMVREQRGGRPGYAIFSVWVFWGTPKGGAGQVWAYRGEIDHEAWQSVFNPRSAYTPMPGLPCTAPDEATYAQIRLQLVVNANTRARVWIDQVEFAPAGQGQPVVKGVE